MGLFRPEMADQARSCLEMMDFEGKDMLMARLAEQGGLQRQVEELKGRLQQLGQVVDRLRGTKMCIRDRHHGQAVLLADGHLETFCPILFQGQGQARELHQLAGQLRRHARRIQRRHLVAGRIGGHFLLGCLLYTSKPGRPPPPP